MASITSFLKRQQQQAKKQEVGIAGFTAFVRVSESYRLTADAPISPVEDGSFLNDHIILKPLTITINGDVSDVHVKRSEDVKEYLRAQAEVGNLVSQYAPPATQAQLSKISALANTARDVVIKIENAISAGKQAITYFGNKDTETKGLMEQFIDTMEALHFGKQVISIDMPYRRLENMVITSFTSQTDNEADSISFTIEAQQIMLAGIDFVQVEKPSPGVNGQLDKMSDKGAQEGSKVEASFAAKIKGALGG